MGVGITQLSKFSNRKKSLGNEERGREGERERERERERMRTGHSTYTQTLQFNHFKAIGHLNICSTFIYRILKANTDRQTDNKTVRWWVVISKSKTIDKERIWSVSAPKLQYAIHPNTNHINCALRTPKVWENKIFIKQFNEKHKSSFYNSGNLF
jgi:hypothetical protein